MNNLYDDYQQNIIEEKQKKERKKRVANKTEKDSYYVRNADLLIEIENMRACGKMSNELGAMIQKIAHGLARKPNWSGYTWIADMEADAVLTVLKYISNFDPNKSKNPFAYITTICTNTFIGYINNTKKHSKIKQALFDAQVSELDEAGYTKPDYEKVESYE